MRAGIAVLVTLGLVLAGAPTGGAQEAERPAFHLSGDSVMELYVAGATLGGTMDTAPPTGDAKQVKSLIAQAINPGSGTNVAIGKFKPESDFTFTSDATVLLHLTAKTAAAYDQIKAQILEGTTLKAEGFTTLGASTLDANVAKVRIPIATWKVALKGGTEYTLNLQLFGASAAGTETEIFLHYGAEAAPTGVTASVDTPGAFPPHASSYSVYLGDKVLSLDPPADAADKSADAPTGCTGSCAALTGAAEFGKIKADRALNISGETILQIWLDTGGPGAVRGFVTSLKIGETTYAGQSIGTFAHTWSASAPRLYRFAFLTRGVEVAEGDEIILSLQLWSTKEAGAFKVVFGSVGRPAGLMIPVMGAAAAPVSALSVAGPTAPVKAEPGEKKHFNLTITNPSEAAVNVTINATGAYAGAQNDGPLQVPANGTLEADVSVAVPSTAKPGDSENVTYHVFVDGAEVANATVTVEVVASPGGGSAGGSGATGNGTGAAANDTAGKKKEGGGSPSLALPMAALAVVGVAAWSRRRRA